MPSYSADFTYEDAPRISVRVISEESSTETSLEALIDTGSDITLFDTAIAAILKLDLTNRPLTQFRGVTGDLVDAPMVSLELLPLFDPSLSVMVNVVFLPGISLSVGNLIGRDVLEYLDFALTHSTRIGYLGRTETLV
jgi:hypothetical protein